MATAAGVACAGDNSKLLRSGAGVSCAHGSSLLLQPNTAYRPIPKLWRPNSADFVRV